ncbi:MAG: hypothetical protein NT009_13935 [Proteobacteria bacterium]|nr:hypothetical protein [Pseudomonadota bacterium]
MKVNIDRIEKDLDFNSDRISNQVRIVGIGIIILSGSVLVGVTKIDQKIDDIWKILLILIGIMALISMILDYFQYLLGYLCSKSLFDNMESQKANQGEYDYSSTKYRLRNFFFWSKQVMLWITIILLIVTFIAVIKVI